MKSYKLSSVPAVGDFSRGLGFDERANCVEVKYSARFVFQFHAHNAEREREVSDARVFDLHEILQSVRHPFGRGVRF